MHYYRVVHPSLWDCAVVGVAGSERRGWRGVAGRKEHLGPTRHCPPAVGAASKEAPQLPDSWPGSRAVSHAGAGRQVASTSLVAPAPATV